MTSAPSCDSVSPHSGDATKLDTSTMRSPASGADEVWAVIGSSPSRASGHEGGEPPVENGNIGAGGVVREDERAQVQDTAVVELLGALDVQFAGEGVALGDGAGVVAGRPAEDGHEVG